MARAGAVLLCARAGEARRRRAAAREGRELWLGLRAGRYTSPHLESVTERIAIDGVPLPPEKFAAVYDEVAPYVAVVDRRGLASGRGGVRCPPQR